MAAGFGVALALVGAAEDAGGTTLRWLEDVAARCARLGVPLHDVHAMVTEGLATGLRDHGGHVPVRAEIEDAGDSAAWLRDMLRHAVTRAYRCA
ncbi:hypothetical protein [Nocardia wallacei]|uniref:hypothetical protein n=1 Tax=Nocardia wallacei TaxID=480035 RepID=UPI00245437C2|nr:hypothetical protein [Nocardia wallacei]